MRSCLMMLGLVLVLAFPIWAANNDEPIQEYEIIGQAGMTYFVYVSDAGLKDKYFVAQALDVVTRKHGKNRVIQVMMFDDKRFTPHGFPMTDAQMRHQKAQYNFNPNTDYEQFVWITVENPNSSPPQLKQTKADIRPGYAD